MTKAMSASSGERPRWWNAAVWAVLLLGLSAGTWGFLSTNSKSEHSPAQVEHIARVQSDIRSGKVLDGAVITFKDGVTGLVAHVDGSGVSLTVLFPNKEKRPANALYLYILVNDAGMMLAVQKITRVTDEDYSLEREKLLPAQSQK